MQNNYYLLPDNFFQEYKDFLMQITFYEEKIENIENLEFYKTIDEYYRILRYELKYSKTKKQKNVRRKKQLPIYTKERSVILAMSTFVLVAYYTISFGYTDYDDALRWQRIAANGSMLMIVILAYTMQLKR